MERGDLKSWALTDPSDIWGIPGTYGVPQYRICRSILQKKPNHYPAPPKNHDMCACRRSLPKQYPQIQVIAFSRNQHLLLLHSEICVVACLPSISAIRPLIVRSVFPKLGLYTRHIPYKSGSCTASTPRRKLLSAIFGHPDSSFQPSART